MEFLDFLYGEEQGYVDVVTKSDDSEQPDRQRFFKFPEEMQYAETYIDMRKEEDVWIAVALFSERNRSGSDPLAKTTVLYADADHCHPSKFRVQPSLFVQTSPGRYHCYWKLDETVSADVASHLSHKIAVAHKDDGCDQSGWIKSKLLRVPGTLNTKHGSDRVEATYTGTLYTVADIEKAYSDIDVETLVVHNTREHPDFLPLEPLEEKLMRYPMIAQVYASVVHQGQSWGDRTFRIASDLFRTGAFTAQEVYTLVWNAPACKFVPSDEDRFTESGVPIPHKRPNAEADTWRHVLSAEQAAAVPYEITVTADKEPEVTSNVGVFLTEAERELNRQNPTFVDEFVEWVETRSPVSAVRLRRTAAYVTLSNVFGDMGWFDGMFGRVYPNLWVLTLGETTTSKKTTIWHLSKEILQTYLDKIGDKDFIINDFTAEALNTSLGERDGKVSLFMRDEIQGWFAETGAKNYMEGLKDFLTDLYNGFLRRSLRQNKAAGQSKSNIRTVFNIYGMGTEENVTAVLKQEDFSSGFMMRWLYAVAEKRDFTHEEQRMRTRKRGDKALDKDLKDPIPAKFVDNFMRAMLVLKQKNPSGFIDFDEEADERLAKWQYHMFDSADKFPDNKFLKPAQDRLNINIHKCCILIAMSQGRYTVTKQDVLTVLAQAEMWYEDMNAVIDAVSESLFQQECNDVERYIALGASGRRNRANILRRFASYRTRQVEEFLEALVQQGRVSLAKEGQSTMYSVIR